MRKLALLALGSVFFLLALVSQVSAADESFADQFLASPLLALVSLIIIDVLAFVYRKIRK